MESHYFCDSILVNLSDNEVIEQVYSAIKIRGSLWTVF